jgi:AcrR family transcriptional regulator
MVYALFRSKPGLLSALLKDAGGDPDIRALVDKALTEPNLRRRLTAVARIVRTIMEREGVVLDVLRQAGTGRVELRSARRQVYQQQREALSRALRPLHDAGALRPKLKFDEALATLTTLASPECFWLLVEESGWSATRRERWLASTAIRLYID